MILLQTPVLCLLLLVSSTVLGRPITRFLKKYPPIVSSPSPFQRVLRDGEIPDYVVNFCPYVHLYSEETYLPYDFKSFVTNMHLEFANGSILNGGEPLNIKDLSDFSHIYNTTEIFLTSNSDFDQDPEWITGAKNRPKFSNGEIVNAPLVLIVVDKGNGWVDAYWFYFYSFNLGPFVMGTGPFGNHVGDWEHSLVRFYDGEPQIVWMSLHGGGNAYFINNMETLHNRPVIFSARGTHLNYASVGQHSHDLPLQILSDFTDRGPLWDPSKNYYLYTYHNGDLLIANGSHPGREEECGDWLKFEGNWGDQQLPTSDPRQRWSPWEWKYLEGPRGPLTKNLLRESPCQRSKWWNFKQICNVRTYVKMGEGIESEGNNSCGNFFKGVRPSWLKWFVNLLTYKGWFCWVADIMFG